MKAHLHQAIPFIVKNPNSQQYALSAPAEELLKSIDKPLSIISVAGQYRTGKSYLLNSVILDKKNVFGVGSTTNACTKGLWLWMQPDPLDKSRMMLVIDTEGLAALDEESNHDVKIFCLAVLLSTTFIYNSFGNIDETALQTLSLVLNLVSTIDKDQVSTRPRFMWIVRDFSLQLIDETGKVLSPKEYLELALSTNSKQNQKLMIRDTILKAFPERDCYTLVKPLIDELKLQKLDQLPIDELRPEFVSQSIELRNKIKSHLKSFKLNGKDEIKGKEYILVVKKYLAAINNGAVPNIIDIWTFIKEEKRREAIEQIKTSYSEKINHKIIEKIPMKVVHIEKAFNAMKEEIKCEYLKMTYEDQSTQEIEEFLSKIYKQILQLNLEESQRAIKRFCEKEYDPFRKKLFSDYYADYDEFQSDLKRNFRELCLQKYEEKFENFKEMIDRFTDIKLIESFKFFEKKLKGQVRKQAQIRQQVEKTMESEIVSVKNAWESEKKLHSNQITDLQRQIKSLGQEKSQITDMAKTEKSIIENTTISLKRKNQELLMTTEELNKQLQQTQMNLNEIRDKLFLQTKQHSKEKALIIQKQEYWNKKNQEIQKKYKQLEERFKENNDKFQSERRQLTNKFQEHIKDLERNNKNMYEKMSETEQQLSQLTNQKDFLQSKLQDIKRLNKNEKKILEERIVSAESNKKPSKLENQLKKENEELLEEIQQTALKLKQKEGKLKTIQEQRKGIQNNYQKQIAIHVQQIQFKEIQIKDLKERYEELKRTHQIALENMSDTSRSFQENNQMRIFQITSEHQKQMESLENLYEDKIKLIKQEVQMLEKHKQELNLQVSLDKKQHEAKQKEWKQSKNILEVMCEKLQKKLKSSEKDYEDITKEKETFYSVRVKQLEEEIQTVKEKASQEVDEIQKKSQEAYGVLKHYSQLEKEQWEKRINDDKEKNAKRLKTQKDEFEKKIQEEKQAYEEELNQLQERLAHMDRVYNQRIQNMQYDYDIKHQKLTNQYMEEKVELNKEIALCQQKLEITKHNFEREMSNKIKQYEESIQNLKKTLTFEYESNLKKISEERDTFEGKCDTLKKNNRQLQQSNLIIKNENEKDKAVFREKQSNYERKISQVENKLQNQLSNFNKIIENINEKHDEEREKLNCLIEKLNMNIMDLEEEKNRIQVDFQIQKKRMLAKMEFLESNKLKYKADYEDMMNKFQVSVNKLNNDKKNMADKRRQEIQSLVGDYEQRIKQLEESQRRMMKDNEDRVARYTTENKSLKDRLTIFQLEKSTFSNKKRVNQDSKNEKVIEELKEIIIKQREEIAKFKHEKSQISERGSFIADLSPGNSRLYQGENRPLISRKSTTNGNTPLISKKSRRVDINEFGGIMKHNDKYKC